MLLSAGPFWWNTWSFYVLLLEIHCHLTPKLPPQYYHLCTSPSWSWSDYLLWITCHWPCEAHLWAGGRRRVLAAALGWCYLCLMSGHLSNRFRTVNVETALSTQNGTACELRLETTALGSAVLGPGLIAASSAEIRVLGGPTKFFQTQALFCLKTGYKICCWFCAFNTACLPLHGFLYNFWSRKELHHL